MNCLHYAALHGYEEIARILVDAGIHIDAVNHVSPTHCSHSILTGKDSWWSCSGAQSNFVKISAAVEPVLMRQYPQYPPVQAGTCLILDTVGTMQSFWCHGGKCFLSTGSFLVQQNASATHIAVLQNFPALVKLLIDVECDLDIPDNVSLQLFFFFSFEMWTYFVEDLITLGTGLNRSALKWEKAGSVI